MSEDNLARALPASGKPCDDALYDTLVAALRGNARGRAFLDEVARRARAADTAAALAALARIEALLSRERSANDVVEADLLPGAGAEEPASPVHPGADLLAQVMALSPEERIALFS
jgi:hypothetical protein